MAETYKPGAKAPWTGVVYCIHHENVVEHVTKGLRLPKCPHMGQEGHIDCVWHYFL